jgi:serine/threonine protein kinase
MLPGGAAVFTWPEFSELGSILLGKYEVTARFRGGFSIVLRVLDSQTGHEFAVKVPKAADSRTASSRLQFADEVKFWLNLPLHPNIVRAHFVAEIDERPALFMEYTAGTRFDTLDKWLRAEEIPEATAYDLAHQLCVAMEFANRDGEIAHRDLKPQNLLISGESSLKVTDFGSAVRVEVQGDTYPKVTSGTWAYAAPEMLRGEIADTRSDLYSFGMILYQMLTRKLPFPFVLDADPNAWYAQLRAFYGSREFRLSYGFGNAFTGCSNSKIAETLGACLSPEPAERPRNFAQLLRLLDGALGLSTTKIVDERVGADRLFDVAVGLRQVGKYSDALSTLNVLLVRYPKHPRRAEFLREAAENFRLSGSPEVAARLESED